MATLSFVELYVKNVLENDFGESPVHHGGCGFIRHREPLLPHVDLFEKGSGGTKQKQMEEDGVTGGGKEEQQLNTSSSSSKSMSCPCLLLWTAGQSCAGRNRSFARSFDAYGCGVAMTFTQHFRRFRRGIFIFHWNWAGNGHRNWFTQRAGGYYCRRTGVCCDGIKEESTGVDGFGLSNRRTLFALFFIQPYLTPLRLQYMLAATGGVMSAVCFIELGRRKEM